MTSQTDAANPALPRVIMWSDIQIWVVFLEAEIITLWRKYSSYFPPHMSLVRSKNSPKHLKMCLNLLTGKWMRSQDWERTCLLSGGQWTWHVKELWVLLWVKEGREMGPSMPFFSVFFVYVLGACEMLWVKNPFDTWRAGCDGISCSIFSLVSYKEPIKKKTKQYIQAQKPL